MALSRQEVISLEEHLESLSEEKREDLALSFAEAALRCVQHWPYGKARLMLSLVQHLNRDEADRQEARPAVLLN
jgi:hypothetical protein